jgi:hypothetical protein
LLYSAALGLFVVAVSKDLLASWLAANITAIAFLLVEVFYPDFGQGELTSKDAQIKK